MRALIAVRSAATIRPIPASRPGRKARQIDLVDRQRVVGSRGEPDRIGTWAAVSAEDQAATIGLGGLIVITCVVIVARGKALRERWHQRSRGGRAHLELVDAASRSWSFERSSSGG